MRPIPQTLLCALLLAAGAAAQADDAAPAADAWVTPALPGVGKMHPLPKAAYQPQPGVTYKIVFAITKDSDKPGELNHSLDAVARTVNLYASAGTPLDHMKFVAVINGAAAAAVLDNEHYKQKFGVDNPNLDLIHKLRAAGIDVAVCGQALAHLEYDQAWVDPAVKVALSALTTITILETQGYVLMPL
jgi:intracellular sulfur oxidation DsrE/DsrF family protein